MTTVITTTINLEEQAGLILSLDEKIAEAEEKQAEALSMYQQTQPVQQPQVAPAPQFNPYNMNDFLTNSMSNPYSNDLMMQNMNFNTLA